MGHLYDNIIVGHAYVWPCGARALIFNFGI